jgi:hypothetical protein
MFRIDIFIIPKRIRLGAAAATLQLLGCTVPGLPQRNKRAQTHDHYYNFPPCLPPLPTVGSDRHVCARCQHEGVGEQRQGSGAARSPPRETTSFGALHACCATFWLHIDDLSCTASENKQTELLLRNYRSLYIYIYILKCHGSCSTLYLPRARAALVHAHTTDTRDDDDTSSSQCPSHRLTSDHHSAGLASISGVILVATHMASSSDVVQARGGHA